MDLLLIMFADLCAAVAALGAGHHGGRITIFAMDLYIVFVDIAGYEYERTLHDQPSPYTKQLDHAGP